MFEIEINQWYFFKIKGSRSPLLVKEIKGDKLLVELPGIGCTLLGREECLEHDLDNGAFWGFSHVSQNH
jgi:hypothetical protein